MTVTGATASVDDFQLRKSLEAFARDLMLLIKSSNIYPNGHPTLNAVANRLSQWTLPDRRASVSLGVTRTEMVLDNRYFGGRKSRITALAGYLNGRKIQRLTIEEGTTVEQAMLLGRVLAMRELESDALVQAVKDYGINSVTLEPLDISKIHGSIGQRPKEERPSDIPQDEEEDEARRGQQAWLWLQTENARPDEIAHALTSEQLWSGAGEDEEEAYRLTYLLSGLGERLNQGMDLLDRDEKEQVLSRLRKVGAEVSTAKLSQILADCPDPSILQGQGMCALVGDLEGDKLVDLMAGIVSTDGPQSERLVAIYGQFAPQDGREEILETVRERLSQQGHRGFAVEVWKTLETFLLGLGEEGYMDEEYRAALNEVAARRGAAVEFDVALDFDEDLRPHLDHVFLSLALHTQGGDAQEWGRLFDRVRQRCHSGELAQFTDFVLLIDEMAPRALEVMPELLREILAATSRIARELDGGQRSRLLGFFRRHREQLLEPALKALREEARITSRRFLVDAITAMGASSLPTLVSSARSGPWYMTRNLAIVLGRLGDPAALPFLTSLLNHDHHRVRRESLRALARVDGQGRRTVAGYAADQTRDPVERRLASYILKRSQTP